MKESAYLKKLTQKLLECGGHIGYGIRPSERRQGYALNY